MNDDQGRCYYRTYSDFPRSPALIIGVALSLIVFFVLSKGFDQRIAQLESPRQLYTIGAPPAPSDGRLLSSLLLPISSLRGQKSPEGEGAVVAGIVSQFDKFDIVAVGEWHGKKDLDLQIALIRSPEFSKHARNHARNIVVEWGNSLYQDLLDRHVKGEDVP